MEEFYFVPGQQTGKVGCTPYDTNRHHTLN